MFGFCITNRQKHFSVCNVCNLWMMSNIYWYSQHIKRATDSGDEPQSLQNVPTKSTILYKIPKVLSEYLHTCGWATILPTEYNSPLVHMWKRFTQMWWFCWILFLYTYTNQPKRICRCNNTTELFLYIITFVCTGTQRKCAILSVPICSKSISKIWVLDL